MDFFSAYEEKHLKVIDTLKMLLYKKDSNIFDKLDFYNDTIFTEPLFFCCVNDEQQYQEWISTLIFCLSKVKCDLGRIETKVLDNDIVYLPSIGYLRLKDKDLKKVYLSFNQEKIVVSNEGRENINYEYSALSTNDEGIEFILCNHPLIKKLFVDEIGKVTEVVINESLYDKHMPQFNKALKVIGEVYPSYFELIKKYARRVIFYEGESNSFATLQAHGITFYNVNDERDEIFFLDNIIHQCAHVFFNTLTFSKDELFEIPYNSNLSEFSGDISDKKYVLYDRFHGLFTQTNINIGMEKCIEQNIFTGRQYYELVGRFSSNMKRFSYALQKFNKPEMYKAEGLKWYNFFKDSYNLLYNKNKSVIEKYDVSNQPYVFDYKIFKQTNDIPE